MATKNYQIQEKQQGGTMDTLHPETNAGNVLYDNTESGLSATNVQAAINEVLTEGGKVQDVKDSNGNSLVSNKIATLPNYILASEKGVNNGVATLGNDGKVPSSQLPAYVDDVLEYANVAGFPATGESGKIYVALDTNKTYRWSGSGYTEISESLALGETSSTAYAGDKGKANADNITNLQGRMTTAESDIEDIEDGTTKVKSAEASDKLSSAKTITLDGDASGSVSTDFSANPTISVTLANSGVTAGSYSAVTVDAKGRVTAGAQVIEVGTSGQTTPSASLAVGGLFFKEIA